MFFDPLYFVFVLPGIILAGMATIITQSTFNRYSHYSTKSGLTGAQAARRLLDANGLRNVKIEETNGFLSDHYDPVSRTLRLSPSVFRSPSLASVGVACHEAGHAMQHAKHYAPLALRTALVPITQFGSGAAYIFFLIGLMIPGLYFMAKIGALLFGTAVLFSIVTLPVEWDASARAKLLMTSSGIVTRDELPHAAKTLNAAFLTYVAAAFTALLTLLYYLVRLGLLGGRGND